VWVICVGNVGNSTQLLGKNYDNLFRKIMVNILIELDRKADKNNLQKVFIRITENKKSKYVPLPIKVHKAQFEKGKIVKHPLAKDYNQLIELRVLELQQVAIKAELANEKSVLDVMSGKAEKQQIFNVYAMDVLRRIDAGKTIGTVKAWRSQLNQINLDFPNLKLQEVTADWLYNYEIKLRKKGLINGGIRKRMQFVAKIINEAERQELIRISPFKIYRKPTEQPAQKQWLSHAELQSIIELSNNDNFSKLHLVANWFIFCCYTGLRYSDIENFSYKKSVVEQRIILYTQKTGEVVSIKINDRVKNILDKICPNGLVQKVITNQKGNEHLKAIAVHCSIDKPLSWHVARHTFATHCSIAGIAQEVTQKLLGHSNIKTTAIYYKIVNTRIDSEMDKLG
jgi:site-specific recombinase XerD